MPRQTFIPQNILEQLSHCLNPEAAQKLIELRADPKTQMRIDELAGKCNEGTLTPAEEEEYDAYIYAANFIGILQKKARARLARTPAA